MIIVAVDVGGHRHKQIHQIGSHKIPLASGRLSRIVICSSIRLSYSPHSTSSHPWRQNAAVNSSMALGEGEWGANHGLPKTEHLVWEGVHAEKFCC